MARVDAIQWVIFEGWNFGCYQQANDFMVILWSVAVCLTASASIDECGPSIRG